MKRCTFVESDGFHHCGSYAFNLQRDGVDQGTLCDVHYWQARVAKLEDLVVREVDPMEVSAEDEAEYWRIHKRLNPENY
jgi:hypothetical protein